MTSPVFFADTSDLAELAAGDTYVLTGAEGRHAATVKRLGMGEALDVVDGAGLRVSAVVAAVAVNELTLLIQSVSTVLASAPPLVLVQALAKGDRDLMAIEAATELGVDAVIPWQSERSIVRWKADRAVKAHAKWVSTVTAAAKQARRAVVPTVAQAVGLRELSAAVANAALAIILHEDATESVISVVRAVPGPIQGKILLIVGPEGGISAQEVSALQGAGAQLAVLGPHVLRSSTAGPAALVLLAEELGRWV
ncbi:MAG: 16S rRNA (uracil(1498)-N(3))-methyltransferase [Acidobacteria bacterium]|nr:16S rRNA (uracil(1498)-N(3))-methyltransferase [Acidobacteriota bacterium]